MRIGFGLRRLKDVANKIFRSIDRSEGDEHRYERWPELEKSGRSIAIPLGYAKTAECGSRQVPYQSPVRQQQPYTDPSLVCQGLFTHIGR